MTENNPAYIDLAACLPVDTIAEVADVAGLALSLFEDQLVGSLLVQTDDGWHRYFLGREAWSNLLTQAAEFTALHKDRSKTLAAIERLKKGEKQ